jgi:hypothetical protein
VGKMRWGVDKKMEWKKIEGYIAVTKNQTVLLLYYGGDWWLHISHSIDDPQYTLPLEEDNEEEAKKEAEEIIVGDEE